MITGSFLFIIVDMTNNLDIVHCPRNKTPNFRWNECFCLPVETRRETYFVGIFRIGNTGRHQFPASKKRGVIFIDLTLLNQSMVIKLLHHPLLLRDGYLKSKTTVLLKYISLMTGLRGQIGSYISVEFVRQRKVGALLSLRLACAGIIIST